MREQLHRRSFLQATGVALALPALDAIRGKVAAEQESASESKTPRRMIFICSSLGVHGPSFFPEQSGRDYKSTAYLKLLEEHRDKLTVFSGLSHPDQAGKDGHSSQMTWLSAARNPGLGGFRNTISVDQFAAEKFGYTTRFPSVRLGTGGTTSQSYNRDGVMVPAEYSPRRVFEKLFLQGKPYEIKRQQQRLEEGRSILDTLSLQAKRLRARVSKSDRQRLDEYFSAIRAAEHRYVEAGRWLERPKPKVDAETPEDVTDEQDIIGRTKLLMELIPLIVQTDSTRVITLLVEGRSDVPPVPGVSLDHHNLSHHGQNDDKIEQLQKIERPILESFAGLIDDLKSTKEIGGSLLDNTMVLFGSNLGNANSHDWRNLPIMMAGGTFKHGSHVAFDKDDNRPLCDLFVTMLQESGLEVDQFATSRGRLEWT